MANQGYDVVVDVDAEVRVYTTSLRATAQLPTMSGTSKVGDEKLLTFLQGDLGHTDLQEDLEFHNSSMPKTIDM